MFNYILGIHSIFGGVSCNASISIIANVQLVIFQEAIKACNAIVSVSAWYTLVLDQLVK